MEKEIAVSASCIDKDYQIGDHTIRALECINLKVLNGEFVSIEGPSGAGKTTLLNIIGGIDKPTSGRITVFRQDLDERDEEYLAVFRCANIGFVFQNYNLISTLTTSENIAFPMELAGWSENHVEARTRKLLETVKLSHRAHHFPSQLSGGEQQRAAFARALANDPPLLLVDEPTANLDEATGNMIVRLISKLKRQKKTILVSTHDKRIVALADRNLHFTDGKLLV